MKKYKSADCKRIQQDALAMIGVELTDDEELGLYTHLADCPECRKQFRLDRKIWQALGAHPALTADAGFERMLSLRLSLEEHSKPDIVCIDRVLGSSEMENLQTTEPYDLSTLMSAFASEMLQ